MIMKPRYLLFSILLAATSSLTVSAADSAVQSQDQAYREYLETYRKAEADHQKDSQARTIVLVAVVAGLIVFG